MSARNERTRLNSEPYRGVRRIQRLPSCLLSLSDLNRLYVSLDKLARVAGEKLISSLEQAPEQSTEYFSAAKDEMRQCIALTVLVHGRAGEQLVAQTADCLNAEQLPAAISLVTFHSSSDIKSRFGLEPLDRFELRFDFSEPPTFFKYNPWQVPTPNVSSLDVVGSDEGWVHGVHATVTEFLNIRKSGHAFLHSPITFLILQWVLGLPAALWICYRCDSLLGSVAPGLGSTARGCMVVYAALVMLLVYRAGFWATRWVFPLMELEGSRSKNKRIAVVAVITSILVSILYDVLTCAWHWSLDSLPTGK